MSANSFFPNVTPNAPAAAATYPSGSNTIKYATALATITVPTIAAGGVSAVVYTMPATNYTDLTTMYRFTMAFNYNPLTFASAPTGNVTLIANYNAQTICTSTVNCRANVATNIPYSPGNMTGVFKSVGGSATIQLYVSNDTTVSLTSGSINTFLISIETITTGNSLVAAF